MQIRRSLWITFAFSNASTVILFAVSLVLARILTPQEIGIFSLSSVVVTFACVFRDLGTSPYLIRKGELSDEDIGSVLGLTMFCAISLALALWFSRHLIAGYFGEPMIAEVIPILLVGFLMVPVANLMTSLLVRRLSAGRSAWVGMSGTAAYATVLLVLALNGFGPKAPAWANAANLAGNLLCLWVVMPKGFRMWPRLSGWGPPLRFSGGVVVSNLAGVCYNSLPEAAIGRMAGAHEVGLYSRANGTVSLFQQVVGPTINYNALPVIAKAYHEGPVAMVSMIAKSSELVTVLAWPIYVWIAMFAADIIAVLYGPTWASAAVLVPWLCLAAAARAPFLMIGAGLHAANQPFAAGVVTSIGLVTRLALVAVLGVSDLHLFVMLLVAADVLALAGWVYASRRYLDFGLRASIANQRRSAMVGLCCLVAALVMQVGLHAAHGPAWVNALASLAVIGLVWLASLLVFRHPFAEELRKIASKVRGT